MSAVDDREKERTITIVNAEGVIQGKPMVVGGGESDRFESLA